MRDFERKRIHAFVAREPSLSGHKAENLGAVEGSDVREQRRMRRVRCIGDIRGGCGEGDELHGQAVAEHEAAVALFRRLPRGGSHGDQRDQKFVCMGIAKSDLPRLFASAEAEAVQRL